MAVHISLFVNSVNSIKMFLLILFFLGMKQSIPLACAYVFVLII